MASMTLALSCALLAAFAFACGGTIGGGGDASVDGAAPDASAPDGSARVPKLHRPAGSACPSQRGPGETNPFDGGAPGSCQSDSDCTAGTNGRCLASAGGPLYYSCSYDACFSDSDCGGVPCECRGSASDPAPNSCVSGSTCRVDSDCGPGGYCSPSGISSSEDCGLEYHCHTPSDTCIDDSDCAVQGAICVFEAALAHWACDHPCYPPP
jgi:hypothetical protein